jgi:hypothetical protein
MKYTLIFILCIIGTLSAQPIVGSSRFDTEKRIGEAIPDGRDTIEASFDVYTIRPDVSHSWAKLERVAIVVDRESKVCQLYIKGISTQDARIAMENEAKEWRQVKIAPNGKRLYVNDKSLLLAMFGPGGELIIWTKARESQFQNANGPFATKPLDDTFFNFGLR